MSIIVPIMGYSFGRNLIFVAVVERYLVTLEPCFPAVACTVQYDGISNNTNCLIISVIFTVLNSLVSGIQVHSFIESTHILFPHKKGVIREPPRCFDFQ